MFFIILGNLEPRPQRLCCSAPQRAVRDAGCPGNTCGSAALHALPRAAARCGARHRGGGNLRGDSWQSAQPWTGGRLYTIKLLALQGGAAPALQSPKDRLAYACWGPAVAQCFRRRHGTVFGLTFGRSG